MPIIPLLGIHNALLVVLPESLYTSGTLVLVPHVIAERPLDSGRHVMPVSIPHSFQREELETGQSAIASLEENTHSFRIFNEGLGDTHLPLLLRNPGVGKDSLASAASVTRPCVFSRVGGVGR